MFFSHQTGLVCLNKNKEIKKPLDLFLTLLHVEAVIHAVSYVRMKSPSTSPLKASQAGIISILCCQVQAPLN